MTKSTRFAPLNMQQARASAGGITFLEARAALCAMDDGNDAQKAKASEVLRKYLEQHGVAQARAANTGAAAKSQTPSINYHLAEARGTTAERKRISDVFASAHSRGRERVCADLLTNAKGWSAKDIVAQLPALPTDKERSSQQSAVEVDRLWSGVWAEEQNGSAPKPGQDAESAASSNNSPAHDVWAKAYGEK